MKGLILMAIVAETLLAGAGEAKVDFARGKWDPSKWLTFKSVRWEYTHGFKQEDDHIVNESPEEISDEELYKKHVSEVYSSIVYPIKAVAPFEVSSTMSFDHLMAPLIVLTPELYKDDQDRYCFKKHVEVVLYNEGINVWHYYYKDGKLSWYLAAFARAKFNPRVKYEFNIKLRKGKFYPRMEIECGGVKLGYENAELADAYYVGVTGCEGRNRFYDFKLKANNDTFNGADDGEH